MMRLAISNIAWRPEERLAIYPLLVEAGVRGLEIAPGLAFSQSEDAFVPSADEVRRFERELSAHGLALTSMQSLLFGFKEAFLFGTPDERQAFHDGISRAIGLAGRLGIPNLVLGSPINRKIPEGMPTPEAHSIALAAFNRLGEQAKAAGAVLALEPNPSAYGTNFLTTIRETLEFASEVDHPGVGVNFDLGALKMNGEIDEAAALYRSGESRVSHVHISEPHLMPAPQSETEFGSIAAALLAEGYRGWFSIEMRSGPHNNIETVRASVGASARALRGIAT